MIVHPVDLLDVARPDLSRVCLLEASYRLTSYLNNCRNTANFAQ